jgi:hypothetical protein
MNAKEQLEARELELRGVGERALKLDKEKHEVLEQRNALRIEVAKDEGLLKAIEWEYSSPLLMSKTKLSKHPELATLFKVDSYGHYNCFYLEENVELGFNDGDISLRFSAPDAARLMEQFVREWGLKIDVSTIEWELEEAEKRAAEIRKTLKFVKGCCKDET